MGRPARAEHRRGEVPRARREPARGDLPGGARRRPTDDVREPPRRNGPRLLARGVARSAGHLDGAPAPGRPGADPSRARPAQRDGPALEPRVPADRERRPGRVVPRRRHVGPGRRRPSGALARRPARHHGTEGRRGGAPHRQGRARATRRRAHRRARGGERVDVARDRRTPARRSRSPHGRAPLSAPRRTDPGRHLHLGVQSPRWRTAAVLHESTDRAAARVHGRRVALDGRLLDVTPAPGRPHRRARGDHPLRDDGRAVRDGVPLPAQGRPHRLGGRPGDLDLARRRTAPALPGRDDRRHRAQGSRARGG